MTTNSLPIGSTRYSATLQAATSAAMATLLLENGLLEQREAGIFPAAGVVYSPIGTAVLEGTTVPLAGYYAFISVEASEERIGELKILMEPHRCKQDVRVLSGGSNFNPASEVPSQVPSAEARKELLASGKFGATAEELDTNIRAAMAKLPAGQREQALIDWEFQPYIHRKSAFTLAVAALAQLSDAEVDAMFQRAFARI